MYQSDGDEDLGNDWDMRLSRAGSGCEGCIKGVPDGEMESDVENCDIGDGECMIGDTRLSPRFGLRKGWGN